MMMKKKGTASLLALLLAFGMLTGCGADKNVTEQPQAQEQEQQQVAIDSVVTRVGSLSGPTSMGLAQLITNSGDAYDCSMYNAPDEIVPLVASGALDIAMVPANLGATLFQKTEGNVQALAISCLGVIEVVAPKSAEVAQFEDLANHTVYLPASTKGATPEAAVRYLSEKTGIADSVTLDFSNAEPAAVVEALAANPDAIAILPQPFATVAITQNEDFEIKCSVANEWSRIEGEGSAFVTGLAIVNKQFAEEHPEAVAQFLADMAASTEFVNTNKEEAAAMIEELGIVKAPIAQKAIPNCNLVCIAGAEMQTMLESYLGTLEAFDASMIGGKLPDAEFYYEAA